MIAQHGSATRAIGGCAQPSSRLLLRRPLPHPLLLTHEQRASIARAANATNAESSTTTSSSTTTATTTATRIGTTITALAAAAAVLVAGLAALPPPPALAADDASSSAAASLFAGKCAGCHAGGGNLLQAGATLKSADLERNGYADPEALFKLIYGGKGRMPGFGADCAPKGQCTFGPRFTDDEVRGVGELVLRRAGEGWAE
jgi:cytochrome c6